MLLLIFKYHWLRVVRHFRTNTLAKSITAGIFLLIFFAIATGIYVFLKAGLSFVISDEFLRNALPLYVYEMFLLITMYLVLASAFITGIFQLFKTDRDVLIVASPQFHIIPWYVFTRVFLASLWPFLVIALPMLLAINTVFSIGFAGLLLSFLSVIVLIALVVGVGLCVIFALAYIARLLIRQISVGFLVFGISLVFLLFSYFAWQQSATADVLELFDAHDLKAEAAGIFTITHRFKTFPSHLSAETFFSAQEGHPSQGIKNTFALVLFDVGIITFFFLLSRGYLSLWQSLQENPQKAVVAHTQDSGGKRQNVFPRYIKSPLGAIFEKELVLLFRNTRDALWIGFLMLIWLTQTGLNFFLKQNVKKYRIDPDAFPDIIQAFQIVVVVYFISAFVLRFAFPSFSTERKTAWLILSAPVSLGRIFRTKFLFYTLLFAVLGIFIGFLNAAILEIPPPSAFVFIMLILISAVTLTAGGMGLGALFPNFETDDPQALSTSLPGLTFIFGSLLYGAAGSIAFYQFLTIAQPTPLVLFFFLSCILTAFFLIFAPRFLKKIEFAGIQ